MATARRWLTSGAPSPDSSAGALTSASYRTLPPAENDIEFTAPEPTARDETACDSDDSTADGIEGDHTREHERQDDGGSATLSVALGAYEHDFRDAEENCDGEERSAGLREPKPMAEPSPIASQQAHARILGQTNERHPSVSVHE